MMSGRPVSSPARVENYPPPLMRFLRTNSSGGGSRSRSRNRGRSVSSPLFVRRSKSSSAASSASAAATQEPSSPKVTCMGQVRDRRSKSKTKPGSHGNPTRRCQWIPDAIVCRPFAGKLKTLSFSRIWTKLSPLSFSCFRRKSKRKEDSPRIEPGSGIDPESVRQNGGKSEKGEDESEDSINPKLFVSPASTPPRNALLLTRSRSAPFRSPSLAFRFWESDNQRETDERKNNEQKEADDGGDRNFKSEEEFIPINSIQNLESNTGPTGESEGHGEAESSVDENKTTCEKRTEKETSELELVRTPVLRRSESGPARIGEEMVIGLLLNQREA